MVEKDVIASNLDALCRPLDDLELGVQEEIKRRFSKLEICHWEGLEVADYWKSMKKSK